MNNEFDRLYDNNYINKIIDKTEGYVGRYQDISNHAGVAHYFRIKSLVFLGRFDEAEKLCYEVLDKTRTGRPKRYIYSYLSQIFFYKKEFIKSQYYNKLFLELCDDGVNEAYNKNLKVIFVQLALLSGLEFTVQPSHIKGHVRNQHSDAFGYNWQVYDNLHDCIVQNYYNSKCYYENKSYVRIFRCQNITINNHYDTPKIYDYVKVISYNDSPDTIATMYPINSAGDLEYAEISHFFNQTKSAQKTRNSGNLSKFYTRQGKKKN